MMRDVLQGMPVNELKELLALPKRCAITSHFNPDGDAVGSSLGLCAALRELGHSATVVLPNTPPSFLQWMPGYADVLTADVAKEACIDAMQQADVVFCLDYNHADRVTVLRPALEQHPMLVMIDHHQEPTDLAHILFSDTSACSTAQMVYDILVGMGAEHGITKDAADCLYTGIMTDSGSFRYGSTTAHTHRVAAQLLEKGVRPDHVHGAVMDNSTESRLRLLGFVLSERLRLYPDPGVALITLSRSDLERFSFKPGDTEGFVNYGLGIGDVRLSALFMETKDLIKMSFRSKGNVDVNVLSRTYFEGGGHKNAAGGRSNDPMERTVERFLEVVPSVLTVSSE